MIATAHIIVGAAVGVATASYISGPFGLFLAFFAGLISHHILDLIIHTDPGSWHTPGDTRLMSRREVYFALFDNILGTAIVLGIFFTTHPHLALLLGATGGNLPDVFHHTPLWARTTRALWHGRYFDLHRTWHWTARGQYLPVGVATTLFVIVIALAILVYSM